MQKPIRGAFAEAIRSGLLASMQAFDSGYCSPWGEYKRKDLDAEGKRAMSSNLVRRMFEGRQRLPNRSATHTIRKGYTTDEHRPDQVLGVVEVPEEVLSNPPRRSPGMKPDWEILKKTIEQFGMKPDAKPPVKPDAWRINVAIAVVLFGPDKVFNRRWTDDDTEVIRTLNRPVLCTESPDYLTLPAGHQLPMPETPIPVAECANSPPLPMFVPIMTFGKLTVIERDEIESIRSIRNQFKTYVEESRTANAATPLCVAVFGPPGSGKSFAVKEIAEDINSTLQNPKQGLEPVEYNVAQFRNVDDLGDAITRAGVINNEGRIPLVFFDEFDCPCNGPLGWLKYFLAPMQDATFYAARQTIKIARAIFVFAGGIYHSFEQFDPSLEYRLKRMNDEESKARQERLRIFRDQKGPDFVSRLRGHINIRPINGDADNTPKPLIRRAIILRGLMQKRGLLSRVENLDVAAIDEDVLYALLTVDRFRHGARSLEAILNMCAPIEGRIEKASLPSSAQLNMHIDSHAFFTRIYRARFRPRRADADRAATPAPGAGNSRPGVSPPEAPAPPPASVPPAIPGGGTKERPAGEPEPAAEGGTHPTAEETGS